MLTHLSDPKDNKTGDDKPAAPVEHKTAVDLDDKQASVETILDAGQRPRPYQDKVSNGRLAAIVDSFHDVDPVRYYGKFANGAARALVIHECVKDMSKSERNIRCREHQQEERGHNEHAVLQQAGGFAGPELSSAHTECDEVDACKIRD